MSEFNFDEVLSEEIMDLEEKQFKNKDELFRYMTNMLKNAGYVTDTEAFLQALYEREDMGSTYMDNSLVLPHGRSAAVNKYGVAICRFAPMKYNEDADDLARIAIMLAIPEQMQSDYIKLLASIAGTLLDEELLEMLLVEKERKKIIDKMLSLITE